MGAEGFNDSVRDRLLDNLDAMDKSIAKGATVLFSVSLLYLALHYNVSTTFRVPLLDVKLQKAHAFTVGVPLIFFLFQYTVVASVGILRIEDHLSKIIPNGGVNPMVHTMRVPTVFSMLFLLGGMRRTMGKRLLFLWHGLVILSFYYLMPVVTQIIIFKWLVEHNGSSVAITLAGGCIVGCILWVIFAGHEAIRRLNREFPL